MRMENLRRALDPRRFLPPRFRALWFTVVLYLSLVAIARSPILGWVVLLVVLPLVLLVQASARWILRRIRVPVWPRRLLQTIPALGVGFLLFRATGGFGGTPVAAITFALDGAVPGDLRDIQVLQEAWTDTVIVAHFRCEPASLREILEHAPFEQCRSCPGRFSYIGSPFPNLRSLPDVLDALTFTRTNLHGFNAHCTVWTDPSFRFAYIAYGSD
jgi:hypothetical protein